MAVEQEGDWPEGLQETAEDLSSARVMNHPVSKAILSWIR